MKTVKILVLLYALIFQNAIAAVEDDIEERLVVTEASSQLIETLLARVDSGYEEKGNNVYSFDVAEYKVLLLNQGESIQLYAGFGGYRVTLTRINEWNKENRFSRAYLDDDNDPVIEADLAFSGGVTAESIGIFIGLFAISVDRFAKHIQ